MTEPTQFTIGAEARCSDGVCGEVTRVVVDPVARAVTDLVVEPRHERGLGRLVPLRLLAPSAGEIRLDCTVAEFQQLDHAEETHFLSDETGYPGYGPGQALSWPYYPAGLAMGGLGMVGGAGIGMASAAPPVTYDTLPLGEVAVRRGQPVHATDGEIGRVQGLIITAHAHHVSHVLLQEGHLWGRKQVAIPIRAVIGVADGIQLNITKDQVKDLPPVDLDHPNP